VCVRHLIINEAPQFDGMVVLADAVPSDDNDRYVDVSVVTAPSTMTIPSPAPLSRKAKHYD